MSCGIADPGRASSTRTGGSILGNHENTGSALRGWFFLLALISVGGGWLVAKVGTTEALLIIGALAAVIVFANVSGKKEKRVELMKTYDDAELVERLMSGTVWEGMTARQLEHSLGKPESMDERVVRSEKQQVWNYKPLGEDQYAVRIAVENDVVVGWERRS